MIRAFQAADRLARWLGLIAGALLTLIALFTVYAALSRYLFNAPVLGASDIARLGLVVVVSLSLAWCGRTGGHVAVDLFVDMLPTRLTRWTDVFVKLAAALIFLVLAIRCAQEGLETEIETQSIIIPAGPFYWIIAGGALLYAIMLALEGVALLVGRPDLAERPPED